MDSSDYEPIDDDFEFTIARGISLSTIIDSVREYLGRKRPEHVEINRKSLNSELPNKAQLSKRDAECLFTGLVLNGAATQAGNARTFADYTFAVNSDRAVVVLDAQRIARSVLQEVGAFENDKSGPTIELTGTFPPAMGTPQLPQVRPSIFSMLCSTSRDG